MAGTLDAIRVRGTTRYRADEIAALIYPSDDVEPAGNGLDGKASDDGARPTE